MTIPFHDLRLQYSSIEDELRTAQNRVFASGHFILGPEVSSLEREFAAYCEAGHAVAVATGTDALWLALLALGIRAGDEVITAANTALPTVSAISQIGARPVLADISPRTYNMDVSTLEPVLTSRTKAIVPVHLYGQPVDLDPILQLARSRDVKVVEDACQAHGARYKGRRVGSLGDAAAFSFYPTKNLGAYGDGGMIVTNQADVAERLRMLRDYGQRERYYHVVRGYNSRLDELQAAMLRAKLRHLDQWNAARRQKAALYDRLLRGVSKPYATDSVDHVYHLYVIRHPRRDDLRQFLADRGIGTLIHYPRPVHQQPAYADLGINSGSLPAAELSTREILSLPLYPELPDEHVSAVAAAVSDFAAISGYE